MSSSEQNLSSIRRQEMPSFFLPLAPATSGARRPSDPAPAPLVRRSSSLSSDASTPSYKILKLAPVHLGEHTDEHKEDWHEIAVE
ncbi:unnamed protein product [Parascedosporium putredinis]|uniref:Uncharacterized protein n=1 Tax=Parascedosporium putredinis TaxID=1442378 RepID=A0A9P1H8I3_9PEZI|nr:unnamed protein product [Parascedosporium putredinis]CAI8002172.1 unnamed protein product [Parascedosporium putredinis]